MTSVEVVRLSCNSCGANLDVGASTRFVTCAHCGAKLEVKRNGDTAFTDVLAVMKKETERIADNVEALRKQADLDALEREHAPHRHVQSRGAAMMGSLFLVAFGVIWVILTQTAVHAPLPFSMFGVVFIAAAIYSGWRGVQRAEDAERANAEYRRRRDELERR